jgi:hypothetical protein
LDQCFNLAPPNWVQQGIASPASADGVLVLPGVPNPATNNFWRIRYVP